MYRTGSSISCSQASRAARLGAALLALALLGGCGFHPLYAPVADGGAAPVSRTLASIRVGIIPDRMGQLLRQDLEDELQRGATDPARYTLSVTFTINNEGAGIQADTSTTYIRMIGRANWTLRAITPPNRVVASGNAHAADGYDILDQQYFSADLESRTATRRLAKAIARQIATELAIRLRPGAASKP